MNAELGGDRFLMAEESILWIVDPNEPDPELARPLTWIIARGSDEKGTKLWGEVHERRHCGQMK
jgi:hypothetical protein